MNQEVTDFLYKIKFPFTIGYWYDGMWPVDQL